ncbi:iron-sulfur cluster assembly protein [Haloprofundus salilacus]|uniref:iron-sulfur cluster assembly protein n=1 Tax=Haloprofundus salilacus TaxID=2876190 RepID=UPI001CCCA389|nr:iron-sulfur cluster assembly protein [Haloprofundus salilacus]
MAGEFPSGEPLTSAVTPRRSAVRNALDGVTDPELDRSIVELDYITGIELGGGETPSDCGSDATDGDRGSGTVTVRLSLPTAWCSPAFAWLMLVDACAAVESLPGVGRARVVLEDHVHETELTEGVNGDRVFAEAFDDADGDLQAVRRELNEKARIVRQHRALDALLDAGATPEQLVSLTTDDVAFDPDGPDSERVVVSVADGAIRLCVPRDSMVDYVEKAESVGLDLDSGPLFRTPEREPISVDEFELVRRRGRLASVNMRGQGGVCAQLHEARQRSREAEGAD